MSSDTAGAYALLSVVSEDDRLDFSKTGPIYLMYGRPYCIKCLFVNFRVILSIWFDFCFTALQHILGHFGRAQLS